MISVKRPIKQLHTLGYLHGRWKMHGQWHHASHSVCIQSPCLAPLKGPLNSQDPCSSAPSHNNLHASTFLGFSLICSTQGIVQVSHIWEGPFETQSLFNLSVTWGSICKEESPWNLWLGNTGVHQRTVSSFSLYNTMKLYQLRIKTCELCKSSLS